MVNNTGTGIVIATCLTLLEVYGFKIHLIIFIILGIIIWVGQNQDYNKLRFEKIKLEIKKLKKEISQE